MTALLSRRGLSAWTHSYLYRSSFNLLCYAQYTDHEDIQEPQDCYDLRKQLVIIWRAILRMKNDHIDIDTLQKRKVRVLLLDLEGDELPKFFIPHHCESLEEPRNGGGPLPLWPV